MRNIPLKQAKTMMVPNRSWRKGQDAEKSDVICTRLILQAVFPAVKKSCNSKGFCEDNLPLQMSEQNRQGRDVSGLASNSDTRPSRAGRQFLLVYQNQW